MGQGSVGTAGRPHRMADNRMAMFYAGGERIDRFRGLATPAVGPEDWVASVTQLPGAPEGTGISWLPDGTSLRVAVAAGRVGVARGAGDSPERRDVAGADLLSSGHRRPCRRKLRCCGLPLRKWRR